MTRVVKRADVRRDEIAQVWANADRIDWGRFGK